MLGTTENRPNDELLWQKVILKYAHPDLHKSIWQIINSFVPFVILWYLMYRSLAYPYWTTLLLAVLASGFQIRLFIIFHDCGHNSFFRSKRANINTGVLTGILTLTPYYPWHHYHAYHHITAGNLDKRGKGDITTLTVDEYLKSSEREKLIYRSFRNPLIMFLLGPIHVIFIKNRFTDRTMTLSEKKYVYFTNLALLLLVTCISMLIGLKAFLLTLLPIIYIAQSIGIWLFYIQHQFEGVQWERGNAWDYKNAAFTNCSFLKLPRLLQWFTGNIGFHHVHHLGPRIPNYSLESCYNEYDEFRTVKPVLLSTAFKAMFLSLWDEAGRRLISFRELKTGMSNN